MVLTTKNREYGYYWTLKDNKWTINEYYQNKWTGGVPDEYWDDIDETQIVRDGNKQVETTSNEILPVVSDNEERVAVCDCTGVCGCYKDGETIKCQFCNLPID